ncbi:uncharacterized protein CEXT_460371 [Caerostris extrusa]|uniref:Uncharacterized protein n=1 Tax=Caerostris extrusa TaxID=172846 RepID=A0AAV4RI15_CAEEX|nr:uncharacterized protein CEXT_460371 [Caerostris extrusa]
MNAINCQRETYFLNQNGMSVYFNTSKNYAELQRYTNGTLKPKSSYKGELSLSLNNFPRRFDFKVLHVNYSQVAVEYTCLPGALNYTASVTVLHRQPVHLRDINSGLQALNLTGIVPNELKNSIRLCGVCDKMSLLDSVVAGAFQSFSALRYRNKDLFPLVEDSAVLAGKRK